MITKTRVGYFFIISKTILKWSFQKIDLLYPWIKLMMPLLLTHIEVKDWIEIIIQMILDEN